MANYPLPKFHFIIEWGGARIGFTEATGLDKQVEVIEYREGNSYNYNKQKMPGLQKFSNITLKRGTMASDLKADGNEVAIETLELAHEGFDVLL